MPQSKALSLSSVAHEYTSPLGDPPFSQIRRAQRCPQANATSLAQLTRRQFNPVKYMSVMRHDRFWDALKQLAIAFELLAVFDFRGSFWALSAAVDTELHSRLGSRTGIYFISLPLTVSR